LPAPFLVLKIIFSDEPLAQLVEHLTFNQRVEGSSPSWLTKDFCVSKISFHLYHAGVAELADAPDLGSGAARRGGSSPFTRTIHFAEVVQW
jgi:hypothetical protein